MVIPEVLGVVHHTLVTEELAILLQHLHLKEITVAEEEQAPDLQAVEVLRVLGQLIQEIMAVRVEQEQLTQLLEHQLRMLEAEVEVDRHLALAVQEEQEVGVQEVMVVQIMELLARLTLAEAEEAVDTIQQQEEVERQAVLGL